MAGLDEVGRGAWAGPLVVGVVVMDESVGPVPTGTADSKLLSRAAREELVPALKAWCTSWSLGEVSAGEIDELGLTASLGLASARALMALSTPPNALILDGPFDFVSAWQSSSAGRDHQMASDFEVHTRVGADRTCGTVAAASIIAKVFRDCRMFEKARDHPGYGFEAHVGYGTESHAAAIARDGLCAEHRHSWSIGLPRAANSEIDGAIHAPVP